MNLISRYLDRFDNVRQCCIINEFQIVLISKIGPPNNQQYTVLGSNVTEVTHYCNMGSYFFE